ncbi:MAG: hypothetical protein WA824_05655 [Candidatus Sulfotelmatobacter sp.]
MRISPKNISLVGPLMLLLAVCCVGQSAPAFSPAVIKGTSQKYSITLNGYDFGSDLCSGSGQDCAYFRIGNPTCNKSNPGECEAGYIGDAYTVNFDSWASHLLEISAYTVGQPGDAIEVGVWNSLNPANGTVWAGNIPPVQPGTPKIYSVVFNGAGENLHITIYGDGFGNAQNLGCTLPCENTNTGFLRFGDYAYHSFAGACGACFYAGFTGDSITMNYTSWSNTKIEVSGFAGTYGENDMVVSPGDPVAVDVWNTNSPLLATTWSGVVP